MEGGRGRQTSSRAWDGHTRNRWQRDFLSGGRTRGFSRRPNFSLVTTSCCLAITLHVLHCMHVLYFRNKQGTQTGHSEELAGLLATWGRQSIA